MDYELKKELKKAGFRVPVGASPLWQPTLSELIEACGEMFSFLRKDPTGWAATGRMHEYDDVVSDTMLCGGTTPEEAVARLWLALHPN